MSPHPSTSSALALVMLALAAGGCATGSGRTAHGAVAKVGGGSVGGESDVAVGRWDVLACASPDGLPVIPSRGLGYALVRGDEGLEMLEQDATGDRRRVTTRWTDDDGTHFYVRTRHEGRELVVRGAGERGIRRVYTDPTDAARPSGTLVAICPMIEQSATVAQR